MSQYYDFSRCVICRSKQNLQNYHGDFEITMLLDTLYLTIMYPFEKRGDLHVKSKKLAKYLQDNKLVDSCGNEFYPDDFVRYFRNALAHFNFKVNPDPYRKKIEGIKLWGVNAPNKAICKSPCDCQKCVPKQYKENSDGAICVFNFTEDQLRSFVNFVIDLALEALGDDICKKCKYRTNLKERNSCQN